MSARRHSLVSLLSGNHGAHPLVFVCAEMVGVRGEKTVRTRYFVVKIEGEENPAFRLIGHTREGVPPCFCVCRGNKGVTDEWTLRRGNKGLRGKWLVTSGW